MNLCDALVKIIKNHGTNLTPAKRLEVRRQLKAALRDNRLIIVEKDSKSIGFFTWEKRDNRIFINNMFILTDKRRKENLLYLRGLLHELFPCVDNFHWKNGKHNKEMRFV